MDSGRPAEMDGRTAPGSIVLAPTDFRVFFFFQAEDGIRDLTVTGVQTCALPISIVTLVWKPRKYRASSSRIRRSAWANVSPQILRSPTFGRTIRPFRSTVRTRVESTAPHTLIVTSSPGPIT